MRAEVILCQPFNRNLPYLGPGSIDTQALRIDIGRLLSGKDEDEVIEDLATA